MLKKSFAIIFDWLYPQQNDFVSSNRWLEIFRTCHKICSFYKFRKGGSVDIAIIIVFLPFICEILDKFEL